MMHQLGARNNAKRGRLRRQPPPLRVTPGAARRARPQAVWARVASRSSPIGRVPSSASALMRIP
jgi:hypothetical protein